MVSEPEPCIILAGPKHGKNNVPNASPIVENSILTIFKVVLEAIGPNICKRYMDVTTVIADYPIRGTMP